MNEGLFCEVCGLPVVPFGGEDICLNSAHERGYEHYSDDPEYDCYDDQEEDEW